MQNYKTSGGLRSKIRPYCIPLPALPAHVPSVLTDLNLTVLGHTLIKTIPTEREKRIVGINTPACQISGSVTEDFCQTG